MLTVGSKPTNRKRHKPLVRNGAVRGEISQAAVDAERREAMPFSVSTLLTRNLQDVFGENDAARRRAAIDEIWTEDGVFYDPKTGVPRGRAEIDSVEGAV